MSADKTSFIELLNHLTAPDNLARQAAEAKIEEFATKEPIAFLTSLVDICCNVQESTTVMLSVVLLKNHLRKDTVIAHIDTNITEETLNSVQRDLLHRFGDIQLSKSTRSVLGTVIVTFVTKLSVVRRRNLGWGAPQNQQPLVSSWPGLFNQLVQVASNDTHSIGLRSACIVVFGECAPALHEYSDFSQQLVPFARVIAEALASANEQPAFALGAAEAIPPLIEVVRVHAFGSIFSTTMSPLLIQAYEQLCGPQNKSPGNDLSRHSQFFEIFKEVAEHDIEESFFGSTSSIPRLLEALFASAQFVLGSLESDDPEEGIKLLRGINEQIIQHCEDKAIVKSCAKDFIPRLFNFFFLTMKTGLDEPQLNVDEWKNTYTPDEDFGDEEELPLYTNGAAALDSLASVIKGKQLDALLLPVLENARSNVSSLDWKSLAASIGLLTYCMEHVKVLTKELPRYVNELLVPCLSHEHIFVRYSAAQCLSQMSVDMAPNFQQQFLVKLTPIFIHKLHDANDCPRLEEIAAGFLTASFDSLDTALSEDDDEGGNADEVAQAYIARTQWLNPVFGTLVDGILGAIQHHEDTKRKPAFVMIKQIRSLNDVVQVASLRIRPFASKILEAVQLLVRKYHAVFVDSLAPSTTPVDVTNNAATSPLTGANLQNHNNNPTNASPTANRFLSDPEYRHNIFCLCYSIELATLTCSFLDKNEQRETHEAAVHLTLFLADLLESGSLKARDQLLRYVLRGLNCMSEYLKEEITPLLPRFIPALIHYCGINCDVNLGDGQKGDDDIDSTCTHEDNEEFGRVTLYRIDDGAAARQRIVRIPTQMIEVKDLAMTILYSLCDLQKGMLGDYALEITQIALDSIGFAASADIRESAAMILNAIVNVIKTANSSKEIQIATAKKIAEESGDESFDPSSFKPLYTDKQVDEMLRTTAVRAIPTIAERLDDEDEISVLVRLMEALDTLTRVLPKNSPETSVILGQLLQKIRNVEELTVSNLSDAKDDVVSRLEAVQNGENEDEDEEEILDSFDENSSVLADILHFLTDVYEGILTKCPQVSEQFVPHALPSALESASQATESWIQYQELVRKQRAASKKGTSGGGAAKKGGVRGKKGSAPAAVQPAAAVTIEPSQDPKYSAEIDTHRFAMLGTLVKAIPPEKFAEAASMFTRAIELLVKSVTNIGHERPLQAAAWTLATATSYVAAGAEQLKDNESARLSCGQMLNGILEAFIKALSEPVFDLEDENFDGAITNIVSIFVRLASVAPSMKDVVSAEKLQEGCDLMLALLPCDGDDDESKNLIYPELVKMLIEQPDHPLFGSEAGTHRDQLVECFQNMLGGDSFSPETRSLFLEKVVGAKKE